MKEFVKYFYEIGILSRMKRTGPYAASIKDPETVTDHVHRATIMAYFIAKMEKANAERAVLLTLFHDNIETRIGDINKVSARYLDFKEAEKKVWEDQTKNLPLTIKDEMKGIFNEIQDNATKEAIISKDADLLECAIQAREYLEIGYKSMQAWIDNLKKRLKTKTAKKMIEVIEKTHPESWWESIKKIYLDEKIE